MLTLKSSVISRSPFPNHVTFSFNHCRVIEGGDWNTLDLVKYLVSVPSLNQPSGIERFQDVAAFPQEADTEHKKFKASDLYQPLDVFRDLDLPIIDWQGKDGKHKWRSNSKKGISDIFILIVY